MNFPKISVIIPVYNTEKYVRESVFSVITQTFKELEIIIVDDGSTDNSLDIVRRLASDDNRIILKSQRNMGQSAARNAGLKIAKGEFIYFMDSDDLLEPDALALCYDKCSNDNSDFVFFDGSTLTETISGSFDMNYTHYNISDKIYKGIDILEYLIDTKQYKVPPYLSFVRRSYLESINLNFYDGIIHEDEIYSYLLYINANKVSYINKKLFKRRIRENSTMTKKYSIKNIKCYLCVINEILSFAQHKKDFNCEHYRLHNDQIIRVTDKLLFSMLNAIAYNSHSLKLREKLYFIKECKKSGVLKYIEPRSYAIMFLKR